MQELNSMFGLITGGCGIYFLYLWLKIQRSGQIPEKFPLLSKENTMKNCLDAEEFVDYIRPRLLIFSLALTVFGFFGVANGYLGLINDWTQGWSPYVQLLVLELVSCVIPLAVLIWFAVCLSRAQKRLW